MADSSCDGCCAAAAAASAPVVPPSPSATPRVPPQRVSSLCPQCGRAWVGGLDAWLLDCDGVVWRGSEAVPGAGAAARALARAGKRVFFVSNNSTKSVADYVRKLRGVCGLRAAPAQVVTSSVAAAAWCGGPGGLRGAHAYVVGAPALAEALRGAGLAVDADAGGLADGGRPFAFGDMAPDDLDPRVRAVVVGFDAAFSYFKLARAASYLRYGAPGAEPGAPRARVAFVATNGDLSFPDEHQLVPGGGVLVRAIAIAAGREPDVVAGKPSLAMLDILAAAPDGLDRARTVMVGDRLDTDILFGTDGGLRATLLVMTGVTAHGEVDALPPGDGRRPTHVLESLGDLPALLLRWGVIDAADADAEEEREYAHDGGAERAGAAAMPPAAL